MTVLARPSVGQLDSSQLQGTGEAAEAGQTGEEGEVSSQVREIATS